MVFFYLSCISFALILPQDKYYEWHESGCEKFIDFKDTINVLENGLIADGSSDNSKAMKKLINGISKPTVIFFPSGVFLFNSPIKLKDNIIIKGTGYKTTKFIFDSDIQLDFINIAGTSAKDTFFLTCNLKKGDSLLTITDNMLLENGDLILLIDNDDDKITSEWAKYSTGQICTVINTQGNQVRINDRIRRNYDLSDLPRFIKILPVINVSIENLTIESLNITTNQTSNINFQYAKNCLVKCIESINCNFAHIDINTSTNIQIEGSYFHHAHSYGGGGKAYGVMIQNASGQCLVYNNIFEHLRHSMILQAGANGNVFAYNLSLNPFWTDVTLPSNAAGDLVLHGNYPYGNLFESNVCRNIVIDDSHGANGPENTFFRNRPELYGIFMNFNPPSDNQNFIANEITNNNPYMGLYFINGTGHFEYGNNVKGSIIPEGTDELNDSTYFLKKIPHWYNDNSSFPPIGIPNEINQFTIEAEVRYNEGNFTACENINTIINDPGDDGNIIISPNPAAENITIKSEIPIKDIEIIDITGNVQIKSKTKSIDISSLPDSMYFITIKFTNGIVVNKSIIKIR
jgi:hypothetical protein